MFVIDLSWSSSLTLSALLSYIEFVYCENTFYQFENLKILENFAIESSIAIPYLPSSETYKIQYKIVLFKKILIFSSLSMTHNYPKSLLSNHTLDIFNNPIGSDVILICENKTIFCHKVNIIYFLYFLFYLLLC